MNLLDYAQSLAALQADSGPGERCSICQSPSAGEAIALSLAGAQALNMRVSTSSRLGKHPHRQQESQEQAQD